MFTSDSWHRRQAVALASTLPDDITDAKIILKLVEELIDGFLAGGVIGEGCAQASRLPRGDA